MTTVEVDEHTAELLAVLYPRLELSAAVADAVSTWYVIRHRVVHTEQCPLCMITDGFGTYWSRTCPDCGRMSMQVVRPGKAQCPFCAGVDDD